MNKKSIGGITIDLQIFNGKIVVYKYDKYIVIKENAKLNFFLNYSYLNKFDKRISNSELNIFNYLRLMDSKINNPFPLNNKNNSSDHL